MSPASFNKKNRIAMKKSFQTVAFIAACILASAADSLVPEAHGLPVPPPAAHTCIDSKHIECDGACTCDGMECQAGPKRADH